MEQSNTDDEPQRDSVSLAFLFYVMTLSGILAACVRMVVFNEFATWPVVWGSLLAFGFLGLVAAQVLAFQNSGKFAGTLICVLIGIVVGVLGGLTTLLPPSRYWDFTWLAFAGSWVLVVVMLILARFQRQVHL